MAISTSLVTRVLAIGTAVVLAAAIAVGRMCTPDPIVRALEKPRYASLASRERTEDDRPTFLDVAEGRTLRMDLPVGTRLDQPAFSPWRDEDGRGQVVGRWTGRRGQGAAESALDIGLGRFRFPGGEPLDMVATEITPVGAPCWYPGTRAQILFADGGGTLHRFAFEGAKAPGGADPQPTPLVWAVHPPGEGERSVRVFDPTWPQERGFARTVIVSMSLQRKQDDRLRFTAPRLWWLRLDAAGQAIVAAGPLTRRAEAPTDDLAERCARVVKTSDDGLAVAYIRRQAGHRRWDLVAAPLEVDAQGRPSAPADTPAVLAESCALVPPVATPDGRWIYYRDNAGVAESIRKVALRGRGAGVRAVASAK